MINVYLSKSNEASTVLVSNTRFILDKKSNIKVLEYNQGTYSSDDLLKSQFMVMVLPLKYFHKHLIGKGQYLQIKEFSESNGRGNILCVYSSDGVAYRIKSVEPVSNPSNWNEYARLELEEEQVNILEEIKTQSKSKVMKNSTTLKNRLMAQFLPTLAEDLGISMDGNICIFKGDDAISINAQGELVNYPKEMAVKCGLYLINKPVKDVKVGDIVKINGSYGKVIGLGKQPSDIRVLTFTGTKSTKVTAKDGLFNTNSVQVVLNIFGDSIQGMNPMMMMLLMDKEEGNDSFSSMLPFLMMQQQQGNMQQNMFGGMNPMMLMMLMGKGDFDPMMLMMMGGFGNPMCGSPVQPNVSKDEVEVLD